MHQHLSFLQNTNLVSHLNEICKKNIKLSAIEKLKNRGAIKKTFRHPKKLIIIIQPYFYPTR
jgi:hypothetical protein